MCKQPADDGWLGRGFLFFLLACISGLWFTCSSSFLRRIAPAFPSSGLQFCHALYLFLSTAVSLHNYRDTLSATAKWCNHLFVPRGLYGFSTLSKVQSGRILQSQEDDHLTGNC